MTPIGAVGEPRPPTSRRLHGTESDMLRTATKSRGTTGAAVTTRKQPANDSRVPATKQKTGGQNVASKPAKRVATDVTVAATKPSRGSTADRTDVRSSTRPEKASGQSSAVSQRDARKPQQKSAACLTASTPHFDSNQLSDEQAGFYCRAHVFCLYTVAFMSYIAVSWKFADLLSVCYLLLHANLTTTVLSLSVFAFKCSAVHEKQQQYFYSVIKLSDMQSQLLVCSTRQAVSDS